MLVVDLFEGRLDFGRLPRAISLAGEESCEPGTGVADACAGEEATPVGLLRHGWQPGGFDVAHACPGEEATSADLLRYGCQAGGLAVAHVCRESDAAEIAPLRDDAQPGGRAAAWAGATRRCTRLRTDRVGDRAGSRLIGRFIARCHGNVGGLPAIAADRLDCPPPDDGANAIAPELLAIRPSLGHNGGVAT